MRKTVELEIRPLASADWQDVRSIYLEGVATGQATFETTAPSWEKWDQSHLPFARLVAASTSDDQVIGWAALSQVSSRPVYSGVAEVSVYVSNEFKGTGVGQALLEHLVIASEQNEIWTLQASVFPENEASMRLHKRCRFREVGVRTRIGKMGGIWRDTVLLERRSEVIGVD